MSASSSLLSKPRLATLSLTMTTARSLNLFRTAAPLASAAPGVALAAAGGGGGGGGGVAVGAGEAATATPAFVSAGLVADDGG